VFAFTWGLHGVDGGEKTAEGQSTRKPDIKTLYGDRRAGRRAWGELKAKVKGIDQWPGENATAIMLMAEASRKGPSADGKRKIADANARSDHQSPSAADGTVTMRAEDRP